MSGSRNFSIMDIMFWSCLTVSDMVQFLAKLTASENEIRRITPGNGCQNCYPVNDISNYCKIAINWCKESRYRVVARYVYQHRQDFGNYDTEK